MRFRKVYLLGIVIIMIVSGMIGCGIQSKEKDPPVAGTLTEEVAPHPKTVGISLPTQSVKRWAKEGQSMKQQLEESGCFVELQYAGDNEVDLQITQLKDMIAGECDVLVVRAVDSSSLTEVLAVAKSKNVPVISYDRLIMDSDAITYYMTFNEFRPGISQAEYIEHALKLRDTENVFNLEICVSLKDWENISFFYGSSMSVLQPYLEDGTLVVPSSQIEKGDVTLEDATAELAQAHMKELISRNGYGPRGTKLDAVLCAYDSMAQGVTQALLDAGYTSGNFPIVTGMDCDLQSVKNMIAGTQSMSLFNSPHTIADSTVKMLKEILEGKKPEVNDTETYDNGTGKIPAYLCDLTLVTQDNYRDVLIDSGYYTEDELSD